MRSLGRFVKKEENVVLPHIDVVGVDVAFWRWVCFVVSGCEYSSDDSEFIKLLKFLYQLSKKGRRLYFVYWLLKTMN
jgi:hypothetical protein